MYLLLVGGCRASWRGSEGCKSVRRVVTSSDRKQTEPMLVLSSLPYPQSRAFTTGRPTAAKPVSFTGMANICFYGDLNPIKLTTKTEHYSFLWTYTNM